MLHDLLKASGLNAVTPNTPEKLGYTISTCEPCQKIRASPKRYRVTMGADNIRFNVKVYVGFLYIEGVPVLHMVDDTTHHSAAQFFEPLTKNPFGKQCLPYGNPSILEYPTHKYSMTDHSSDIHSSRSARYMT